jgi:hypothetical protein
MNPKRKLRLILLVGMVPFASLLLYVVRSHHLPKEGSELEQQRPVLK